MQRRAVTAPIPQEAAPARAAAVPRGRLSRRPRSRAAIGLRRALGAALALPALLLALGFLWFLDVAADPPAAPDRRTDGIVVLTGGAERVRTALALLTGDQASRLLVSGAHRDVTLAELAAAADLPVAALQGRVTLGRMASNTHGNAAEAAAWARAEGLASIRVVTAGYHMPRATMEMRRVLPPGVELVPHPVVPPGLRDAAAPARPRTWTLLLGEYAKLIGAALGVARGDPPAPEAGR